MACVVRARWTAKEGEGEKVAEAIRRLAPLSRRELGVLPYRPRRSPGSPNAFFCCGRYADAGAHRARVGSEHARRRGFGDALERLEGGERSLYETVDAYEVA